MATPAVVERLDVVEHRGAGLGVGRPRAAVDEVLLEARVKALEHGVVEAVPRLPIDTSMPTLRQRRVKTNDGTDQAQAVVATPLCSSGKRRESKNRGPSVRREERSNSVSAGVLTEGTRHFVGLGASAQFRDLPVLEDGLAIDGILKSFQRRLEMLDAGLKLRDPQLRIDVWLRPCRLGAWRLGRCALCSHCEDLRASVGLSRERKRKRDPTSECGCSRGSRSLPQAPRLGAVALR